MQLYHFLITLRLGSPFSYFALDGGQVIESCWTKIISMQLYMKVEKHSKSSCIVIPCTLVIILRAAQY